MLRSLVGSEMCIRDSSNSNSNTTIYNKMVSNPLRLQLDCSSINDTKVLIKLQNSEIQSYAPILPVTMPIKTICTIHQKNDHTYSCKYTDDSAYNITVYCDGSSNSTVITTCPNRLRIPSCNMLSEKGTCSFCLLYTSPSPRDS